MSQHFRSAFVPHDLPAPIAGAAQGPLAGLTVAVKDMYDIAGTRTGGGNPDWLDAHPPAPAHAAAVRRLLEGGATVIGKTVCDEFFFSVTGANAHYGTPVNPRAPGRLPGGPRAARPRLRQPARAISPLAATREARFACRLPSVASMASARLTVGST